MATAGARRLAEEALARADEKTAQYEAALRAARGEIYREQENTRKRLQKEQGQAIQQARQQAEGMVREAKQQLAAELESAKTDLRRQADSLAEEIAEAILRRRPA